MSLASKRVVILGGSSGIGLAVAAKAAEAGAQVHIVSSKLSSVEKGLETLPASVQGAVADSRDSSAIEAVFSDIKEFDHLVYTAGEELLVGSLADYDVDAARKFFEIRLLGALEAAKLAVPRLRKGGSIVFTTGTGAFRPGPGWAVTGAVLNGIIAITKSLALEIAPIRVNAVAPGVTRSPLWKALTDEDRAALYESISSTVPLGRPAELEEIAREYIHLMEQSYATGAVSVVDGGSLLV